VELAFNFNKVRNLLEIIKVKHPICPKSVMGAAKSVPGALAIESPP
jgi:hypothetical protein